MITVLNGLQGSGKSTVAEAITQKYGTLTIDLDTEVEKVLGMKIGAYIENSENKPEQISKFRKVESEVLAEILRLEDNIVLSLGGGTLSIQENRDLLESIPNVYIIMLAVDVKTQINRLLSNDATGNESRITQTEADSKEEELRLLHEARDEIYRENADFIVEIDDTLPPKVIEVAVSNKIKFNEGIIPLRNQINYIDDLIISILNGSYNGERIPKPDYSIVSESMIDGASSVLETIREYIENPCVVEINRLLLCRFILVDQVGKLKEECDEAIVQNNRKQEVIDKWGIGGGNKSDAFKAIYHFIHAIACNLETKDTLDVGGINISQEIRI